MHEHTLDTDTLEGLTDPEQVRMVAAFLEPLKADAELLLFISPTCGVCPHQVQSAATVALASPRVVLEIVDTTQEPRLANEYEVRAVPTTVVDDELVMTGVVAPVDLALLIVERQGPEEARRVFRWLVGNGRTTAAAERLADGRGTAAFLELWTSAEREGRASLLAVAREAPLYNPFGLGELVAGAVDALESGDGLSADPRWREDTADLLAALGDDDARPALERLLHDPDPDVAGAAEEALDALD
ncbi:MAG TPA: thioredoxin family protein [Longimicrobiales bacterium]|nr:thioredoxin family protein [Longimicrobiales bacterium]